MKEIKKPLHNKVSREELKAKLQSDTTQRTTLSFYKYYNLKNPKFFRDHLYLMMNDIGVMGRIYVSYEGINGQISVPNDNIEAFKSSIEDIIFMQNLRLNYAIEDDGKSFFKLTIKVRNKIVADGLDDATFDASNRGVHLSAKAFNELTNQDDTIVVDMRNHYESEVGHFDTAITPDVETFKEALVHVEDVLQDHKDKNIIMYCTGGIRCEKASAYYKHKGFEKVFQLEGGIIEYARQVDQLGLDNKFKGKNFVFDERLGERIGDEIISQCHQCGSSCDTHINCSNEACHILFIQCESCAQKYASCCSVKCKDFNAMSQDEQDRVRPRVQFNGTKFGKGRYKALHKDEALDVK